MSEVTTTEKDGRVIIATKATPWPATISLMDAVYMIGIAVASLVFPPMWAVFILALPFTVLRPKAFYWRKHAEITADKLGIRVGKSSFPWPDIARLTMQNHVLGTSISTPGGLNLMVVGAGGSALAGSLVASSASQAMHAVAHAGKVARAKQLAKHAWRVEIEFGGKPHVVAGGLEEATAYSVIDEIGKAYAKLQ